MSDIQTKIPLVISQRDIVIPEPAGHADMKNIILSYALYEQPTKAEILNILSSTNKSVFQMTGGLSNPGKISLRFLDKQQIIFDLKDRQVRLSKDEKWIPYDQAITNAEAKSKLKMLVNYWENLRWQNHLEE